MKQYEGISNISEHENTDVSSYKTCVAPFTEAIDAYKAHIEVARSNDSPESRILKMEAFLRELTQMYEKLLEMGVLS